jgi:LmbE family N-acetylglucosaminyl deacetylase
MFTKKIARLFLGFVLMAHTSIAQNVTINNSADILQKLKKLNTVGSVLYIAAHPDDENTRLLGWLANERKLRTGYLSLTRGDGGQNLIGKEQGELLGLIRTQELLAARRTDGAEQFFSRAFDFGFSKNPEETFSIWDKEMVLSDVVWVIRKFKPDVIICRFPTTGEGGHGHHTASAILALEAFNAAADPKRFPEQLKETQVWQAKRIFWNTFNFGGLNTTAPNQLKVDVGVYNPLLGKSYGEIAADSRSMHKSQGFGSAKSRGEALEYFKFLKGDTATKDLFDSVNQTWTRFSATIKIKKLLDDCITKYNPQMPEASIKGLTNIYKQLQQLDEKDAQVKYWKTQKLKETQDLLIACAGLWMEATAADYVAIPGKDMNITVQFIARNKSNVVLQSVHYLNTDTNASFSLKQNELYSFKRVEQIRASNSFSNPYWLVEPHLKGSFVIKDQQLIGKAENDPAAKVKFNVTIEGLPLSIERGVVYKSTDPVKGEVYRPLEILPPATVNVLDPAYLFRSNKPKKLRFSIRANAANVNGTLQIKATEGWDISITNPDFKLSAKGDEVILEAIAKPIDNKDRGMVSASLLIGGKQYDRSIRRIDYDHIPSQFTMSEATAQLVKVDLKKAGNNIGYIPGAGDELSGCLQQVGYNVTVLSDDLLASEDLSQFDAIVTGVRAYNTSNKLQVHYNKLMKFVENGGNLIVQYNTNNQIGPIKAKIGPYPFTISRDRVTNENAEIRILKPEHPILNFPNKITNADFDGWIQERGIYFATEVDKNYQTIFSMNDPKEKMHEGSLIVAKYGKGNFVYTGLVFFRELPAAVPGAYRLFVNLLSIPKNE